MKVIKPLQNKWFLLKEITRKFTTQEGGFLNFLKPLMTAGLPMMKNVLTPLRESVSIPLVLTAEASAIDAAIQKKIFGSGTSALTTSNEDTEYIMKIVKWLDESGLLINGIDVNNRKGLLIKGNWKKWIKRTKGGFFPNVIRYISF